MKKMRDKIIVIGSLNYDIVLKIFWTIQDL